MAVQSALMLLLSLWVTLIRVKGSIRVDLAKTKVHKEGYDQRHRRSPIQGCSVNHSPDGYSSLEEDDVSVEFIKNHTTYIARLRWKPPKVNNATPTSFLIHWGVGTWSVSRCKVIKNKTSWDITPWKSDETLSVAVTPIPTRRRYSAKFLQFHPTNKETSTTPFTNAIAASEVFTDESPTTEVATTVQSLESGSKPQANPDNSKIIIGSVTGGAVGILLIVIVVILYLKRDHPDPPPSCQGCMYVSYCRETNKFIEKVQDFVLWFRGNGFDVQMVDNVLSKSNAELFREIGRFRFCKQQISQAKFVFLIVSAAYLRLCRLDEKEANGGALSAEEKFVYAEIVQIYHDILENGFKTDRFIPILFGVKETELPHWIKEFTVYTWPEDKTSLLYRLNKLPEYAPLVNNNPGENLVRSVGCCKIL